MGNLVFGVLALVGLLLSLAVHILAVSGSDMTPAMDSVWPLHVGALIVFFAFVFSLRKEYRKKLKFADLRTLFPSWVIFLGIALFAYVILNFVLFMSATEGGNPMIQGGQYVLSSHGRLILRHSLPRSTEHFQTNVSAASPATG